MSSAIAPLRNHLNAPFWEAAERGAFVLPYCPSTDIYFWPPSPVSPWRIEQAAEWRTASPFGVLTSRVVYRRPFQAEFAPLMPFAIGLVELEAGPRLQVHIAAPDSPEAPHTGDHVTLQFAHLIEGAHPILTALKTGG